MRFHVEVDRYLQNPSARCFDIFVASLKEALVELGHEVVDHEVSDSWSILIGLQNAWRVLPASTIVYNAEQINTCSPYLRDVSLYHRNVIWDFAAAHRPRLEERGAGRVVHCPIGYTPGLERVGTACEDIDVLFYGLLNGHRREILLEMQNAGVNVHVLQPGTYGPDLDGYIARAKIVLNLHYYPGAVHEIFRTSYLFANRKCVVSEDGGSDLDLEALAEACAVVVPRHGISAACKALLKDDAVRAEVASRGYDRFRRERFDQIVARAIAATG